MLPHQFTVKDSGARATFASGMVRDTTDGKLRPDLVKDGPMYLRWVVLMTKGAIKYAARNWMKATGIDERDRFLESTERHYAIWFTWRRYGINIERLHEDIITREPLTEDHAAAIIFNVNGVEYVEDRLAEVSARNLEVGNATLAIKDELIEIVEGVRSGDESVREYLDRIAAGEADAVAKAQAA